MGEKFVGKSKTIIALVLSTVVLWAPQIGLDFSEEDAGFIMDNLHELVAAALNVWGMYGRVVAETKLRFSP